VSTKESSSQLLISLGKLETKLRQSGNVKLIAGRELAKMMVEAGLGVRKTQFDIPRVDEEYLSGLA